MTSSDLWDEETAALYEQDAVGMFTPAVVEPAVHLLASLAGDGRALGFAIGTGRGYFVVELFVPPLRQFVPGQVAVPFEVSKEHTGFDTFDVVTQECTSHHYTTDPDGTIRYAEGHFRYIWPAECDLMAQLAGMNLVARYADWDESPFTEQSTKHVSVWRRS
ncbi:MAG: hypothetical protein ACKOW5_09825 [Actinomycetales bacterium]